MKHFLLILLISGLPLTMQGQTEQAGWRGPSRDGIYPANNIADTWPEGGPRLLWKFDNLGCGYSSPAVTGSRVFITGTVDSTTRVFCFDLKGKLLWEKALGPDWSGEWPGIYSSPAISGEQGFVVNGKGVLYAFSTLNGDVAWKHELIGESGAKVQQSGFLDNLVLEGDLVICAPGNAGTNIIAFDRKSGKPVWKSGGKNPVTGYSTPILISRNNRKFYVYQDSLSILALDVQTGKEAWRFDKLKPTTVNTPIYRDGYLLTLDNQGALMLKIADNDQTVSEVWRTRDFFPLQGDAVLLGNRIYGRGRNKFSCIDWLTGKEISSIPLKGMVSTVISSAGLVFAYEFEGDFRLLKPGENGFSQTGIFRIEGGRKEHCSHPVIAGDVLYVRHDNSLFAYDLSKNGNPLFSMR